MSTEILKPFGPSILKVIIPDEIVSDMNNYVDKLILDQDKLSNLDHGKYLEGNVHREFRLGAEFMQKIKWPEFLASSCQKWLLEGHNISIKKFDIIASWIIQQYKNDYNPIHYHSGQISGVGYLKVPQDMGETIQKSKKNNYNGKLVLIDGSKKFLCNPTYVISPKKGDFYFFPSSMMHTAYSFLNSLEERRYVSFNVKIDEVEEKCLSKGVKLTDQRRIIAKVMSEASDHPAVDEHYERVSKIDSKISIATVYRTVKLFEESGILAKHEFKGGKARYEELNEGHYDHLIDVKSGEIIEFVDEEIEKLQKKVAEKYGYTLVDHKLELYGIKKLKK